MALLLAMYQKMRLIREKNQLVLDQTKVSSKLSRVQKNIERTQKRYTSLFANLDSQAKMMQSQAKIGIQNMFGLGLNNNSMLNYGGMTGFVMNVVGGMMQQGGFKYKDSEGAEQTLAGMSQADIQKMMAEYMQNGGKFTPKADPDNEGKYLQNQYENWNPEQVQAFMVAIQQGQMAQQQQQFNAQQMCQQYESNVSIWLDAQKSALEAEQDAMLEPLNYEETMLELEKEQKDTRLQRINEEIETYKQLVSQEVKNTTPTFGLG